MCLKYITTFWVSPLFILFFIIFFMLLNLDVCISKGLVGDVRRAPRKRTFLECDWSLSLPTKLQFKFGSFACISRKYSAHLPALSAKPLSSTLKTIRAFIHWTKTPSLPPNLKPSNTLKYEGQLCHWNHKSYQLPP